MKITKKRLCLMIGFFLVFFAMGFGGSWLIDMATYPKVDTHKVSEVFKQDASTKYYYHQLSDAQKKDYQIMYYAFKTFQEEVPLKTTSEDDVSIILESLLNDHTELYYISYEYSYRIDDRHGVLMFYPKFLMNKEDIQKIDENIKRETKYIIEKAKQEKTDLDKMEVLYRYLIESVEYKENKDDQIMTSALLDKKSVCAGYAKAYQYLLEQVGIEASYMTGLSNVENKVGNNERHAWVMVHLGDDYYYSDPTWGDCIDKNMEHPCMFYFLMDSDEMLKCYEPDVKYEKTQKDKLDYFKENETYMEAYNKKILSHAVQLGLKNKTKVAEVKCANKKVYQKIVHQLKNTNLAYDVLSKNGCWNDNTYYGCDEKNLMIELYYK